MKSFINFHHANLILKLAETREEIEEARQLRYKELVLFHNKDIAFEDCFDDSDWVYDHLLILEEDSGEVVGTYRLGRREHLAKLGAFAIESKFDISSVKAADGEILELSRMAIRQDHRDGIAIKLLWKGIMDYCLHYHVKYMIAVISLYTFDPQKAKNFLSYVYHNHVSTEFDISAKPPVIDMNILPADQIDMAAVREEMHPALKSYMKMNCAFAKSAHLDDKMLKSVDVMLIIDYEKVNPRYLQLVTSI